ncbi:hypothetical protein ACFQ2B_38345 [Streptomyces stramineus]
MSCHPVSRSPAPLQPPGDHELDTRPAALALAALPLLTAAPPVHATASHPGPRRDRRTGGRGTLPRCCLY